MSSFCTIVKHNIDSQIYADSKTIPLLTVDGLLIFFTEIRLKIPFPPIIRNHVIYRKNFPSYSIFVYNFGCLELP